ncbi:hypothetical protein BDU57DRAFT_528233 [Ampelomyces quisqualis]|uniref:Uncharacterized protein n=1 Tax=Ampelomyces quisqualis TaxID=50730 RepID=A0A6A5QS16_AMPQU|nr:hypothetical protein BDU57DRAFT_528233 [Ampelomyces quisqualis]
MPENSSKTVYVDKDREPGAQYGQHNSRHPSRPSDLPPSYAGRPSQMQVALPGHDRPSRASESQNTSWGRPSQMQVALPGQRYAEPLHPTSSGRPSQMQVALRGQHNMDTRHSECFDSGTARRNQRSTASRLPPAFSSVHEGQPSQYDKPSQRRSTRPAEPYNNTRQETARPIDSTVYPDRPQAGRTVLIRPGEPHHFGARADHARGEYTCTLCRCNKPNSHGDAYTMLNSPRGLDINGHPIDWQEAKRRMLDHHGKNQISHAQENAAVPFVFDAQTAEEILRGKEELRKGIRAGYDVRINVANNNVDWHNDDGHAKPYVTGEGAKTRFDRGI